MLNKTNVVTIKLNLDTTEFEDKLNRIERKLERVKALEDTLKLDKALENVKNVVNNYYGKDCKQWH